MDIRTATLLFSRISRCHNQLVQHRTGGLLRVVIAVEIPTISVVREIVKVDSNSVAKGR
jgi:hypothetical protein